MSEITTEEKEQTKRSIDWRQIFKDVVTRMRNAGESQEMGARWMATAAEEALAPIFAAPPIELSGVREELGERSGAWISCTGCHETSEGIPTGPYSSILRCHIGVGCRECGGIGAVWDNTDYSDIAKAENTGAFPQSGMSLRDHYAGLAMQAAISGHFSHHGHGHGSYWAPAEIADYAHEVADAMLAARSPNTGYERE